MGCWRCSVTGSCSTLCDPMDCSTPGFPVLRISRSLLKLVSTESVMPSNHVTLCHPLLLLPSIFPSIRVFSVSVLHIGWPKYWSFSTSSSNKYSGLISLGLTDLFSLQSKGLSRVFSRTTVWKHQFLVAQTVKNLPEMQKTQLQSLGQEGPLEKGMASHSSILAWTIPWTEEPGGLQSRGSQRVGHDWAKNTFTYSDRLSTYKAASYINPRNTYNRNLHKFCLARLSISSKAKKRVIIKIFYSFIPTCNYRNFISWPMQ